MKIAKGEAKNVELVGYHDLDDRPGFQMALQVVDGRWFLYLAHFWHKGWTIMDVTEPADPKLVRFIPWKGGQNTITIKIQVADGTMIANLQREIHSLAKEGEPFEEGILIFDVKDPVDPKLRRVAVLTYPIVKHEAERDKGCKCPKAYLRAGAFLRDKKP